MQQHDNDLPIYLGLMCKFLIFWIKLRRKKKKSSNHTFALANFTMEVYVQQERKK